ncbi:MAG TPA: imidazole glycerol phosphate synthase subunit HisH [Tepidisphaeraceae bacterium]|nr:imidazole glycerol phosphate synthase subunit HisH [Tepidisphaeraceae bacterium]
MSISIVDYGMANLRSVQKAFASQGFGAEIISRPEEIDRAGKIVLPGVGAFKDAIATLRERKLDQAVIRHIQRGKPFLGICLGLQLLFDIGYEDGEHTGLGVIAGVCRRFEVDRTMGLKVPHMGWNQLVVLRRSPLLVDLPEGAGVYFVHSYHVVPKEAGVVATETDYGGRFVSSVWRDNLMATQFHPEKSQRVGLKMLANFAEI